MHPRTGYTLIRPRHAIKTLKFMMMTHDSFLSYKPNLFVFCSSCVGPAYESLYCSRSQRERSPVPLQAGARATEYGRTFRRVPGSLRVGLHYHIIVMKCSPIMNIIHGTLWFLPNTCKNKLSSMCFNKLSLFFALRNRGTTSVLDFPNCPE